MILPNYAILFVFATTLFLAIALSSIVTMGIATAELPSNAKKKFAIKFGLYMLVWVGLSLFVSYTNLAVPSAEQTFPVLAALIIGSTLLGTILLYRSPTATAILKSIPAYRLATIQVYRVIGVVFLLLEADGLLSHFFAYSTGWGDIFVGLSALIVGYLLWRDACKYRYVAVVWCFVGMGDLLFVLYKAINSAPGPLQTAAFDLPTVIIGYFPFSIIPILVVPISLILHIMLLRRILLPENSSKG